MLWLGTVFAWLPVAPANAQAVCECCSIVIPSAPNNLVDFTLAWELPPAERTSLLTVTMLTNSAVASGIYEGWCADAQTSLLPDIQDYEHFGNLYASADPSLNLFLALGSANTNSLVSPEVWKQVNYLINHRTGYNYWDVQGALWHFVGGPAVATPPYPAFNEAAVNQLISDTILNAPAWCPQPGDKVAAVVAMVWPVDNQIIIIELPCPGTTPKLAVTVSCPTDCGLVAYGGSVSNAGNVSIADVFVFSSQPASNTVVAGPLLLAPGAQWTFGGSYLVPCITNLAKNTFDQITTNLVSTITTNSVEVVWTNTAGEITTNVMTTVMTNSVDVITTNLVAMVTTNVVEVVATNVGFTVTTNTIGLITTNVTSFIITNLSSVVTTNSVLSVTTNTVMVVTTNQTGTASAPAVSPTFGTIAPAGSVGTVTDRFVVGTNFNGLTYSDSDHGYAATKFYSVRHDAGANASFFDTIAPTGATGTITDRFLLPQYNFDALAYAAPDVGYGPVIFYYLRHDAAGQSTFGTITPGGVVGVVTDQKVVGTNFDALTFSATDVGFGANLFYYVRHDSNCNYIFGTIDPAQGGPVTDRFSLGEGVDALVFTATDVGYGNNNFYYLRHDVLGHSTLGTIFVTGLTSGNVIDRFSVGTNVTELSFTPTDVLYGPNLFYYLRGTAKIGCSQIVLTTNAVTTFTTNLMQTLSTNLATSFTTNNVTDLVTNDVVSLSTNSVTLLTTNIVTTLATNNVAGFATNSVVSFTTNSFYTVATNMVTTLGTNSVISFATNTVVGLATNTVITYTTNIVAGTTSITVSAVGRDICQDRLVTAVDTCSESGEALAPLVIGGGAPAPRFSNGNYYWSFASQTGLSYTVQFKSTLSAPLWTDLQTVAGTGGIVTLAQAVAGQPAGFYRLKIVR